MAETTMPKFVVFYSKSAGKYVNYISDEGGELNQVLEIASPKVWNPLSRFEVVPSTAHPSMVHIRSCYNNRFLKRKLDHKYPLIAAGEDEASEHLMQSSTLFLPEFLSYQDDEPAGTLRLLHLESVKYVQWTHYGSQLEYTWVDEWSPIHYRPDGVNLFQVIDWESLVVLRKHVAFKGDNGRYLGLVFEETGAALRFVIDDEGDKSIVNEVVDLPDGTYSIKNVSLGAFWRVDVETGYIWADGDSSSVDSIFGPVKVNDNTIALRNLNNNMFCTRYTNQIADGLNANQSQILETSHLALTELVTSRRIEDIKFNVPDGWVDNYKWTILLNPGEEVSNDTMKPQTLKVKIPYKDKRTSTWRSTSSTLKLGPNVEIHPVKIPQVTDSFTIEMTAPPFKPSYVWGDEESTVEQWAEKVHEVVLEPMTTATLSLRAVVVSCGVPLSYTRYDVLDETTRKEEVHVMVDGLYTGTNYANFMVDVSTPMPITKNKN
ncbi:hypothetical protein LINGRAHAP2_LOCUS33174 [Linum grandiflorum]